MILIVIHREFQKEESANRSVYASREKPESIMKLSSRVVMIGYNLKTKINRNAGRIRT